MSTEAKVCWEVFREPYRAGRWRAPLFRDLILSEMGPVVTRLETALAVDLPVRVVAERAVELFVLEVYGTSRRDIVRIGSAGQLIKADLGGLRGRDRKA